MGIRHAIVAAGVGAALLAAPAGADREPTLAQPGVCAQIERDLTTEPAGGAPGGVGGRPVDLFDDPRNDPDSGVVRFVRRLIGVEGGGGSDGRDATASPSPDVSAGDSLVRTALTETGDALADLADDPLGETTGPTGPLGDLLGDDPLGGDLLGSDPLGGDLLGSDPLGGDLLGSDPLPDPLQEPLSNF